MEQVRGDATPKVVGARSALDASGPSRGRPSARWSMRPGHNARRAEGRRWPRDASGKLRRCAASFTVTRSRAKTTERGAGQDRPDIVKHGEPGSTASWNLDPERLVFNTETPDLDQHLPPLRIGVEMARAQSWGFSCMLENHDLRRQIAP